MYNIKHLRLLSVISNNVKYDKNDEIGWNPWKQARNMELLVNRQMVILINELFTENLKFKPLRDEFYAFSKKN